MTTQGVRVSDFQEMMKTPNSYTKDQNGFWWCHAPGDDHAYGRLAKHEVEEHEDGTISVTPSILITMPQGDTSIELYHGYLTKGVWYP